MTKLATPDRETIHSRLDQARKDLLATLDVPRTGTLSDMEADAVAAAIEDAYRAPRQSPPRPLTSPICFAPLIDPRVEAYLLARNRVTQLGVDATRNGHSEGN